MTKFAREVKTNCQAMMHVHGASAKEIMMRSTNRFILHLLFSDYCLRFGCVYIGHGRGGVISLFKRARRNAFVEELCLCGTTFEKPSLSKSFLFHATSSEKPSLSAKNPLYRRKT